MWKQLDRILLVFYKLVLFPFIYFNIWKWKSFLAFFYSAIVIKITLSRLGCKNLGISTFFLQCLGFAQWNIWWTPSYWKGKFTYRVCSVCVLQWTATHARPAPVSMEAAVCRRATAIAATVLRASRGRAARSVSHWAKNKTDPKSPRSAAADFWVTVTQGRCGGRREKHMLSSASARVFANEFRRRSRMGGEWVSSGGGFPMWVFFFFLPLSVCRGTQSRKQRTCHVHFRLQLPDGR